MIKAEGDNAHNDFILQMPSMTKLNFDGAYYGHVEQ
jgi:hypothetical protein